MKQLLTIIVLAITFVTEAMPCEFNVLNRPVLHVGDTTVSVILGEVALIGPSRLAEAREMRVRTIRTYFGEHRSEWRIAVRRRLEQGSKTMPAGMRGRYWMVIHPPGTEFNNWYPQGKRNNATRASPIRSRADGYLYEADRFGLSECGAKGILRYDPAASDSIDAQFRERS